ncbi:unannotated protein [freshwater metagenome]|uniref:Unannotated protein n=1 Tax=freshwater metagenome TaxID=449393 RepID=A0A6J7DEC3_9ZZZZ
MLDEIRDESAGGVWHERCGHDPAEGSLIDESQFAPPVRELEAHAQVRLIRGSRLLDEELTTHAEVGHQGHRRLIIPPLAGCVACASPAHRPCRIEWHPQVLSPAADAPNPASDHRLLEGARLSADRPRVQHLDLGHLAPRHPAIQSPANDLDLGQLWHGSSSVRRGALEQGSIRLLGRLLLGNLLRSPVPGAQWLAADQDLSVEFLLVVKP